MSRGLHPKDRESYQNDTSSPYNTLADEIKDEYGNNYTYQNYNGRPYDNPYEPSLSRSPRRSDVEVVPPVILHIPYQQQQRGPPMPPDMQMDPLGAPQRQNNNRQRRNDDDDDGDDGVHRQVQLNAALAVHNARWRLPLIVLVYFIFDFLELAAIAIVLGLTRSQACDEPAIRGWLIFKCIRNFIYLVMYGRRLWLIDETQVETTIGSMLRWSTLVLMILAQNWVETSQTCEKTSPALYWTAYASIIILYCIYILLPMLLIFSVLCCLPVLLNFVHVFNIGNPNVGATEDKIEAVPEFKFNPATYGKGIDDIDIESGRPFASSSTGDAGGGGGGGPGGSSAPTCGICWDEYKQDDLIKRLPCRHDFHSSCIGDWLKLNDTCPYCRHSLRDGPVPVAT